MGVGAAAVEDYEGLPVGEDGRNDKGLWVYC